MSFDWRRRNQNIGDHQHLGTQILNEQTGEVDPDAVGVSEEALAAALASLDLTPEIIQNIFNDNSVDQIVNTIVEVVNNNAYITQITENNTFVTNLTTLLTQLTEIAQNNTYVTNLVTQIVAQINGKKGVASELATLGSDSKLTASQVPTAVKTRSIEFVIDGGGSVITTGIKGDIEVPFAGTITAARLFADQSGSIVVNIWKDTYANFPPVVGDKITASAPPTISTATKSQDTTLTGWTTSIAAGDILRFNVDSITTITRVTLSLTVTV